MGDDTNTTLNSPRRLRKHSYKEALSVTTDLKMSGILPDVNEVEENHKLIDKDDFGKKNTAHKLDSVAEAINKLYDKMHQMSENMKKKISPLKEVIYDEPEGILPQMSNLVDGVKSADERIQSIYEENVQLRDEVDTLKGIVHKLSAKLEHSNSKIDMLMSKSMEDNLIFTGILDDQPNRNVRKQLRTFLHEELGLPDVRDVDILSVYRLGSRDKNRNRPIIAQCVPDLRRYILRNASLLKHRTNKEGGSYYINQQLPEAVSEQRREIRQIIKEKKNTEEPLPKDAKSTFIVRNAKLYINGQLIRKKVVPPSVQQLFPDDKEQAKINNVKMRYFHTTPEEGSKFKVALLKAESFSDVSKAYIQLFQKYPSADHIAVAAIIQGEEAFNDDGEFGSGYRMLRTIKQSGYNNNIAVFMIRHFGGVNLGPRRFTIITDLVEAAIHKTLTRSSPPTFISEVFRRTVYR